MTKATGVLGRAFSPSDSDAPASWEVDLDTALALARATARTVKALSPEASELFNVFLQREVARLKAEDSAAPDAVVRRLREFFRD